MHEGFSCTEKLKPTPETDSTNRERCDQQIVNITKGLPMCLSSSWDPGASVIMRIIIHTVSFKAESFLPKIVPFMALFICRLEKSL